ncbi:hypothetical protein V499_00224 [Pseudogymnoascus sp. VKM F-103]|nr:hypothetical protein V499_00224 [Pseudogymnoascus sp. VKM F-103]
MFSHRFFRFVLCAIALLVTHASAYAPSNDTSVDDQVSCVYPMSGQYGVLPRVLFYVSLIFAVCGQHFEWLVIGALASAMTFSATTAIHIFIIFATHWRNPPILDLDSLSIALIAMVSVTMFLAFICFSSTLRKNLAGVAVVKFWFITMIITGTLALFLVNDAGGPPQNSNAEVACFLPDKTLLTGLAQLNGRQNLECIYDCFLTRGSVLKPQEAATVIWGAPVNGALDKTFYERYEAASDEPQMRSGYGPASDKEGYALIGVCVSIGSVVWVPLVIMIEWSMRNIPVEENPNAVGQWGPWVAALFAIIGSVIHRYFEPEDRKERRKTRWAAPNETVANSPINDMPSSEGAERSYDMDNLSRARKNDYTPSSDEDFSYTGSDDDAYMQPTQRHYLGEETARYGRSGDDRTRSASTRSDATYMNQGGRFYTAGGRSTSWRNSANQRERLYTVSDRSMSRSNNDAYVHEEEADIGTYGRGNSTSVEERPPIGKPWPL